MDKDHLPADLRPERMDARLRLVGAGVVLLSAIWLLSGGEQVGTPLRLAAIAGIAIAIFWVIAWRRTRRLSDELRNSALTLDTDGFTLKSLGERQFYPWSDVCEVEVDEEKLQVRVDLHGRPSLWLDARFGGLGLYDLADRFRRARLGAAKLPAGEG